MEKNGSQNRLFLGARVATGKSFLDRRFDLGSSHGRQSECSKARDQVAVLVRFWTLCFLRLRDWGCESTSVKQDRPTVDPAVAPPHFKADVLHVLVEEGSLRVDAINWRWEDPFINE